MQKKITSARLKEYKKKEFICFIDKVNDDFEFILEGRALFQAPDTDGKLYVTDGITFPRKTCNKCSADKCFRA